MKKYNIGIDNAISQLRSEGIRIGCVYPKYGESYYINSNIQGGMSWILCLDGDFFCENIKETDDIVDKWNVKKEW